MTNQVKFTVFKVSKTNIHRFGKSTETAHWRVSPPVGTALPGDEIEIKVVDPHAHHIEIYSDALTPNPVSIQNGKSAKATVRDDVTRCTYYEFEVFIDDQFAEAGSAPGIIID
jgi:hypothetical protein